MKSKVALFVNPTRPGAAERARELVEWLEAQGHTALLERGAAAELGMGKVAADDPELAGSDLAVVLGGDGMVLAAARVMAPEGGPLLPLGFGEFGFLAVADAEETLSAVSDALAGKGKVHERMMLSAEVWEGGGLLKAFTALNDAVVTVGTISRTIDLETYVGGRFLAGYAADGVIVSTPTGATAYSLSAGGPIVAPTVPAMILTPICAHTLSARSIVFPDTEEIEIRILDDLGGTVFLTMDGQTREPLKTNHRVVVKRAEFTARFVSFDGDTFYDRLQKRFRWGERFGIGSTDDAPPDP